MCDLIIKYMLLDQSTIIELVGVFSGYSFILAFFAPMVGGEVAVLFLSFLSVSDSFPLWGIIIGSFFGMLALDSFWFFVPRTTWLKKAMGRFSVNEKYKKLESRIESFSNRNDIFILFFSKVLVGTRILVLAYLSMRKISFTKFLVYDAIATFLWAVCLGYFGWFAGLGFYSLTEASHNFTIGVTYVVLVLTMFYGVLWCIRLWTEKK